MKAISEELAAANSVGKPRWKIPLRLALVVVVAFAIGAVLKEVTSSLEKNSRPAGFSQGVLQGALMPMALPNLLFGRDVPIYAQNNQGVAYKLGYTTGVNACGALFFGVLFWRLHQWRKRAGQKRGC